MRPWSAAALRRLRDLQRRASGARGFSSGLSDAEKITQLRAGKAPATGRPLSEIAAEVWGWNTNPVGPGNRSGAKILRRPLKGPLYEAWYPEAAEKNPHNQFRLTEKQERWRAKLRLLRAAGKGPPKKGAGKRKK